MPAETHSRGGDIDAGAVLELFRWIVHPAEPAPAGAATLAELGVADELAVLELWEAATEEFAERGHCEPDLPELLASGTLEELAVAVARAITGPSVAIGVPVAIDDGRYDPCDPWLGAVDGDRGRRLARGRP